ncbi:MAG: nitroreductase [Firmicutes bacterium]|nr:nitroreductase [Bacillota bacterium]
MHQAITVIFDRYSCRDFSPEPLSEEQIDTLVKAALAAPSAVNRQPWHIIAITNKQLIDEMDAYALENIKAQSEEFYKRMMDRGGKIFYNAPCLIVIAKDNSDYATLDTGIVSQNIALAAHAMGLGSVICGMARSTLEGAKGEEFKKRIQLPEGYTFGMSVCVGTALSDKEPHELDMQKVTYIV